MTCRDPLRSIAVLRLGTTVRAHEGIREAIREGVHEDVAVRPGPASERAASEPTPSEPRPSE
jgi:hypothetical protein